ncbi:MAG: adenylyl-sulfate kinase [Candidatus Caenarcaniphilales bacterium]|jgi:adenylyl-sulfate kinase|nr:adenylyl-sulfate kinase [Candidatus Caenarcaniphilales bacterium]
MAITAKPSFKLNKGLTLWLTGLSGSGKTTLAQALSRKLMDSNPLFPIEIIDGDEIRRTLSKDLGFSKDDRNTNVERVGFLAGKIAKHGVLVIVPVIAPYASGRHKARYMSESFVEVYIKASLETVKKRDPKGLYKQAEKGEVEHMTGLDDPYEIPANPELIVETDKLDIENSVRTIIEFLLGRGYIKNASNDLKNFLKSAH